MRDRRAVRRLGRALLVVAAALALTAAVLVGAVEVIGHTGFGRKLALAALRVEMGRRFAGGGDVGGLDGDLFRQPVLRDVVVRDPEGVPAVEIARLSLRWRPVRLLRREVRIVRAEADGVKVHARWLGDGRLNLRVLPAPRPGAGRPWAVFVDDVRAMGLVAGDGLVPILERAGGPFRIEAVAVGRLRYRGPALHVEVDWAEGDVRSPAAAHVRVRGAVARTVGLRFDDFRLALDARGEDLRRLWPAQRLVGPLSVEARISGGPWAFDVGARLRPRRGEAVVEGYLGFDGRSITWHADGTAHDLDASQWQGLPPLSVDGRAEADGSGRRWRVQVGSLHARAPGFDASASGEARAPGLVEGRVRATAELSRAVALAAAGGHPVPRIRGLRAAPRGPVHLDARVAGGPGRWRVQADLDGHDLTAPGLAAARELTARFRLEGAHGHALIHGRDLLVLGRPLADVELDLVGERRGPFALSLSARGPALQAALEAKATWRADGIAGRIERLRIAAGLDAGQGGGVAWTLPEPARFAVDGRGLALAGLLLARDRERIAIDGSLRGGQIDARLGLRSVDLAALARAFRPGLRSPALVVDADLRAGGTTAAPTVRGRFDALLDPAGERWRTHGQLEFARRRLRVEGEAVPPVGGALQITAALPLPLRDPDPIELDVTGRGLAVSNLTAFVRRLVVAASSKDATPAATPAVAIPTPPGARAAAEAVPIATAREARAAAAAAPGATVAPRLDGLLDIDLRARGTLADPSLEVRADARGLRAGALRSMTLRVSGEWRHRRATGVASLTRADGELLRARGEAELDLARALAERRRPDGPIRVQLEVPGCDLAHLDDLLGAGNALAGRLEGRADVTGLLSAPRAAGEVRVFDFSDGRVRFDRVDARAGWDGATVRAAIHAAQHRGGRLAADLDFTPRGGALSGSATVRGFDVSFLPAAVRFLRAAGGSLDADLRVAGTSAAPRPSGTIRLRGGSVVILDDTRRYSDIQLDAELQPGHIVLRQLSARSDTGTLKASGSATLDGLRPTGIDLAASADGFQLAFGGVLVARLDGQLKVRAERSGAGLRGSIAVERGRLELPRLGSGGKDLQSLGPLEDVVFVDPAGRRVATVVGAAPSAPSAPFPLQAEIRIPGAFALRGHDIQADVHGELRLAVAGPRLTLDGQLDAAGGGWVDIVGNRFNIERAHIDFAGRQPPDPELDIRLSRRFGDVTVFIDVTGHARKPNVDFSSEPPRYSKTQIIGLLLSGDPGNATVDERSLDQRVVGALSGAVIGTLKSKLLPGLPIDVLRVQLGGDSAASGLGATRVEVGKYLTQSVYVSYVHQFGTPPVLQHVNTNQVTMEWRFARWFELDTSYGDAGVGGVDFAFRLRF